MRLRGADRACLPLLRVLLRCRQPRGAVPPPRPPPPTPEKANQLATYKELADFLAGVERRAFKQAVFSVRDEHLALDIVQEAMFKLAEKYADRPSTELPMLFQRILQNAIRDFFRRQKVRSLWTTLLSALSPGRDDEDVDPLETLRAGDGSNFGNGPVEQLEK